MVDSDLRAPGLPDLDPVKVEAACHGIIHLLDSLPFSESEKLAALLAATHTQRKFMLEVNEELAAQVPLIEELHRQAVGVRNATGK